MTYPTVVVEVSWDTDPLAEPVWERVDNDLINSISIKTGRSSELEKFQTGSATLVVDNSDRRFDPFNASGELYGKLKQNKRLRVYAATADDEAGFRWGESEWDDTTEWGYVEPLFHGFIDGFPQSYGPSRLSQIPVGAKDAFKLLDRKRLPGSVYELEVASDEPHQWVRFADQTNDSRWTDASGNDRPLTFSAYAFASMPTRDLARGDELVFGCGPAPRVMPEAQFQTSRQAGADALVSPLTFEAWVRLQPSLSAFDLTFVSTSGALYPYLAIAGDTGGVGIAGSKVIWWFGAGSYIHTNDGAILDDKIHHVVVTKNGSTVEVWIDGVSMALTTVGSVGVLPAMARGILALNPMGTESQYAEWAQYNEVLTPTRIAAHHEAGTAPWDGDAPGVRMARVLDYVGWPSSLRDLEVGSSTLGPARFTTKAAAQRPSALEYLQKVANSEQGLLFVNHKSLEGELAFRARDSRLTDTRSTTVQWVFSDDDTDTDAYRWKSVDIQYDEKVINKVTVRWVSGEVTVTDDDSIEEFDEAEITIDTEQESEAGARSIGEWVLARYAQPRLRCRSITIDCAGNHGNFPAALGVRISDRVRVRVQPQSTGDPIEVDVIVEGIDHEITNGVNGWITTIRCSDADVGPWFVWDTAEWDDSSRWAA